jgi:hypothetical protein
VEETELTLSGATTTWTNAIPAGVDVLGVTTRVTANITGASGYQVGDGTDVDRWADVSLTTLGDTTDMSDFTDLNRHIYTAQTSIVITAKTSDFTGGTLRVTLHYLDVRAATA